jgi:hypothetical protein
MKHIIIILMGMTFIFCSRVTTKPDRQATTSGTLGTVKGSDRPATLPVDSTRTVDTATFRRDSVPR